MDETLKSDIGAHRPKNFIPLVSRLDFPFFQTPIILSFQYLY